MRGYYKMFIFGVLVSMLTACSTNVPQKNTEEKKATDIHSIDQIQKLDTEDLLEMNCSKAFSRDLTLRRVCFFEQADRKYQEFQNLSVDEKLSFNCSKVGEGVSDEFSRTQDCEQVKNIILTDRKIDESHMKRK